MSEFQHPVTYPMDSAPRDGSRFLGHCDGNFIGMLWHPQFNAFVSKWRRMLMAPGYKWILEDGSAVTEHDHSPTIHEPDCWMPLPENMR